MGHLLVQGWILAALFLQTGHALTVVEKPDTVTPTSTPVPSSSVVELETVTPAATPAPTSNGHHHHHHHHWTYISRPLPSRKHCSARSSSFFPSARATPTPSAIAVSSNAVLPSSAVITSPAKGSSISSLRPVPSRSAVSRPHWTYISRPLPHRSQCSGSSSAMPTPSVPASTPVIPISTVVSVPTSTPYVAPSSATTTATGSSTLQLATSTVLSTRTATITACPSTVPDCPARSRTTFVTTETIVVSTTVCPVADSTGSSSTTTTTDHATSPSATEAIGDNGIGGSSLTTSTVLTTRTATVTACPSSVTDCSLRSKTTYATTETLVVATTVYPVSLAHTSLSAGDANAATAAVTVVNPQVTNSATASPQDVTTGSQSGSAGESVTQVAGSSADTVYTTTIAVESCSDDDTCTGYTNTVVMTQASVAQSSVTSFPNTQYYGSGVGGNRTVPASSTHLRPQSSFAGTMRTAVVSATRGAVDAVYTGAASAGTRWSMLQVAGTMMVILAAIFV